MNIFQIIKKQKQTMFISIKGEIFVWYSNTLILGVVSPSKMYNALNDYLCHIYLKFIHIFCLFYLGKLCKPRGKWFLKR